MNSRQISSKIQANNFFVNDCISLLAELFLKNIRNSIIFLCIKFDYRSEFKRTRSLWFKGMKMEQNLLKRIVELLEDNQVQNKRWLKPTELEIVYGFKEKTFDKKRMKKEIPFSKIGNLIRYDRRKIDKWLENHQIDLED